ncbi:glycosyltransferase family protein [Roseicella aquatilis]|uniref:Glycosyl transferase family 1 n=1 Tax=Roseicella aquatilis TaxID=2527868 RepID=A0A4R4DNB0_9PROT|nr:glycosyl transferase family 1 [Roseicella aquatilis]TCZ61305.1 glycosyl transferase family 1 [Roseicella aquatilis]
MRLQYFVHDLSHADVARRVEMLRQGGAEVTLLGFHRKPDFDRTLADRVIGLGQTHDGNFLQRVAAVLRALAGLGRHAEALREGDAVMARNLEMLVLAAAARRRFLPGRPLTYECLDIHRLMTAPGLAGRALRRLEAALLRRCDALVTSSPGFLRAYFEPTHGRLPRPILVENKVLLPATGRPARAALPPGPPWRIGWFGVLRCRRSLDILAEVARRAPGLVEIVVAGRPAPTVFGGAAAFEGIPGLRFLGPYGTEAEAAALFSSVHFTWTPDFYEAGANSEWLLPNRLYRAAWYGSVPIGLAGVETGRWLAAQGVGLLLDGAEPSGVIAALQAMTPARHAELQRRLDAIPTAALATERAECESLVRALTHPGQPAAEPRAARVLAAD